MDRRERMEDGLVQQRGALRQWQAGLWTAMPAILQSFNAAAMTCTAQVAIRPQTRTPDGNWVDTTISLCVDCPVVFPRGGGFSLTLPLQKGNEGLLVFAARCIDGWWQSGGVQNMATLRMHDLSDGFFIPGATSQPNLPSAAASTDSAQLRSDDGECYVEIAAGHVVNVVAPGGAKITGDLVVTGSIKGNVVTDTANNVTLSTLTVTGVQPGSGTSGTPTPGS